MKPARTLRYTIIGLIVLTILLFALSIYTLFTGLFSAIQGDAFPPPNLDIDEPTGDWRLTLDARPGNDGIIGVKLFIQLGVLSLDGEYLAKNSTSVYIDPRGQTQLSLTLLIPSEDIQNYLDEEEGIFEMKFGISTLADLVGFMQTMRIRGEAPI